MGVELQPAVLAATPKQFHHRLKMAEQFKTRIHLDIMDGKFVSTRSVGAKVLRHTKFIIRPDIHAMVNNPVAWLPVLTALQPRRVYVQVELGRALILIIAFLRSNHIEVGLAINPKTPLGWLAPWVKYAPAILVLNVMPGRYGSAFKPAVLRRIRTLRRRYPRKVIVADGHVDAEHLPMLRLAGATALVVGSSVMLNANPLQAWKQLKKLAK